ncbi:hypothetical protein HYU13_03400 [Candidatus Woesearchaeota archaeon]|nr:hypothetical protein [Candidatus Woesearchaeota archaeon]
MHIGRLGKKGDGGLSIGIFILVVFLIIFWIDNAGKECKRDSGCKENQYCGSDFSCHDFPGSASASESGGSGIVWASGLLALGMVAAALILTKTNFWPSSKKGIKSILSIGGKDIEHKGHEGHGHTSQEHDNPEVTPYYESVSESYSSSQSEEADEEGEFKHGHGAGH